MQPTIVYFAGDEPTASIKIGQTTDLARRLGELRSGVSRLRPAFRYLATMPGTVNDELSLHELFDAQALGGEWFSPSDELLALIGSVRAGGYAVQRVPSSQKSRVAADTLRKALLDPGKMDAALRKIATALRKTSTTEEAAASLDVNVMTLKGWIHLCPALEKVLEGRIAKRSTRSLDNAQA